MTRVMIRESRGGEFIDVARGEGIEHHCGVVAFVGPNAARNAVNALEHLQHRGDWSAGAAWMVDDKIERYVKDGRVKAVFDGVELPENATMAICHVRYPTNGSLSQSNLQPTPTESGVTIAWNGHIANLDELKRYIGDATIESDTEGIQRFITKKMVQGFSLEEAVRHLLNPQKGAGYILDGACSLVCMAEDGTVVVGRDRHGIRPLCIGTLNGGILIASESVAITALGGKVIRTIRNGEVDHVDDGIRSGGRQSGAVSSAMGCVVEDIYFKDKASINDWETGRSVKKFRRELGRVLALNHGVDGGSENLVVLGVPKTGLPYSKGYAKESGLPRVKGFIIRDEDRERSFQQPSREGRELVTRGKMLVDKSVVEGRRLIVVDDSVIRGITSKENMEKLWEAGAEEIHLRLGSPMFVRGCYQGIDIQVSELVARSKSNEEIAQRLGVTSVDFITVDELISVAGRQICTACFGNPYSFSAATYEALGLHEELAHDLAMAVR